MKKRHISLLSMLLILLLVIGGSLLSNQINKEQEKEEGPKTITFGNGDYVYVPAEADIDYDREEKLMFYKDILYVSLREEITDEQAEEFARVVDGKIVGRLQGAINILQIQTEGKSINELRRFIDRLEEEDVVKFADISTPSFITDLASDKMQEQAITGGLKENWWEEAIYADRAWEYVEKYPEFQRVKVVVLESGDLDTKDPALNGNVSKSKCSKADIKEKRHASRVTKIITAIQQPEGIRGIATGVADVEFTGLGESFNEAELLAIMKCNLEDGEKTIFNHSWGALDLMTQDKFESDQEMKRKFENYNDYWETEKNSRNKTSEKLISGLDDFLKSGYDDFLIIQSAGNGLSRKEGEEWSLKAAAEAEITGYFANINKERYEKESNKIFKRLKNDFEEIRSHIIVVGGAERANGRYEAPIRANYGPEVDIAAPSEKLYFYDDDEDKENDEKEAWGTSYSAPMVTGAAALVWTYHPELTAGKVKQRLLKNAVDEVVETKGEKKYYPMLNAAAFLPNHYERLMETYRIAIKDKWGHSQLDEYKLGPDPYDPSPLPDHYGYVFKDINNDQIDEMIVGVNLEDGRTWINEIYSVKDQTMDGIDRTPIKLVESALRKSLFIYEDGTIEVSEITNSGAGKAETRFYDLQLNGSLHLKAGFIEDMGIGTYESLINPNESMSKKEVDELLRSFGQPTEFSFIPFISE